MNSIRKKELISSSDDPREVSSDSFEEIAEAIISRISENLPVRRNLPGGGRVRIDRQLPFLCIYRSPQAQQDKGTRELVTTEAAYLFASGDGRYHQQLSSLCQSISQTMREHFGTFLFLEIWSWVTIESDRETTWQRPQFEIISPELNSLPTMIDEFEKALSEVSVNGRAAKVTVRHTDDIAPPGLESLAPPCEESGETGNCRLGLAVKPIYHDPANGALYPLILQEIRRQLADAIRKAVAGFTGLAAGSDAVAYQSLGPSSLVKATRIVDQQLSDLSHSFDFLLQVTPTNSDTAWQQFVDSQYTVAPLFHYRPLPYRPSLLKRHLFEIEIERIEDPSLAHLFWEKQIEIDRQLTALRDIDTPDFLFSSLQLYSGPDESLVELARNILDKFPDCSSEDEGQYLSPKEVAHRAREEIEHYHQQLNEFTARVEICDHIASGIMVSQDRLLISDNSRIRTERVEPLLHHEIGTHLLTYFNGKCQPFRQLYAGLAGYDELQEGLAVLAEYLCGGLTVQRFRGLAARVLAVDAMLQKSGFCETFAFLHTECGLAARTAYVTTLRVHRGGGFTKDIIYLRGFRDLLNYLSAGHDIEPLYVGKIGLKHLPYVQELRRRGIIAAPKLLPRFWHDERHQDRLNACREVSILQILEKGL